MMEIIAPANRPAFMSKVGLIDADYIKYHVISRCDGDYSTKTMGALIEQSMAMLRDKFTASNMLFCFSGSGIFNFRTHVAFEKLYKGNRTSTDDKDVMALKEEIVDYIVRRYPSLCFKELEADDLLCMLQDEETFIYSEDKDLKQVPGTHWNVKKDEFFEISESQALRFLMRQMIEGDTVDNIAGLKGYGPAACDTLLTNVLDNDLPVSVLNEYMKVHGALNGIDAFVESWNLLKLRLNRGLHFREKYKHAFDTLELLK